MTSRQFINRLRHSVSNFVKQKVEKPTTTTTTTTLTNKCNDTSGATSSSTSKMLKQFQDKIINQQDHLRTQSTELARKAQSNWQESTKSLESDVKHLTDQSTKFVRNTTTNMKESTKSLDSSMKTSMKQLSDQSSRLANNVSNTVQESSKSLESGMRSSIRQLGEGSTKLANQANPWNAIRVFQRRIFYGALACIFVYGLATSIPKAISDYYIERAKLLLDKKKGAENE